MRHSHSVSLTPDGMRLRKRAEEVVDMIEKTEAEFAVKEKSVEGDIHIGAGETRVMRHVAEVIQELRKDYPNIPIHLYSGNLEDMTERLDKGLLDFGVLIQPSAKYDSINLPEKDAWGARARTAPWPHGLQSPDRICSASRASFRGRPSAARRQKNEFIEWFKDDFEKLDVVATLNLVYNSTILAESGIGRVVTLDGLVNTSEHSNLCFRFLEPRLESGLNIVWKKYQVFSPAAEVFLQKIQETFGEAV